MLHKVSDAVFAKFGVDSEAVVIGHVGGFAQTLVVRFDIELPLEEFALVARVLDRLQEPVHLSILGQDPHEKFVFFIRVVFPIVN